MLKKIHITNYRVFDDFTLEFADGLNIVVGDNDAGKTTVLEAVNLALTGRLGGAQLSRQLTPFLFNQKACDAYIRDLHTTGKATPPEFVIDLYLEETDETAALRGTNNSTVEDTCGLRIRASFCQDYEAEYKKFIADPLQVKVVPTEYYQVDWTSFAGNAVTSRSVRVTASLIDATAIRLQSGTDRYLQQIVSEQLDVAERVELARAYRSLRESFAGNEAITAINTRLEGQQDVSDKKLSLAMDISQRASWETGLIPHLDDLPIQFVGSGGQNMLKILLALNRVADRSHAMLIEEPENHQSPASLNMLVRRIAARCQDKQVILTTHSSFVLNKLGLDNLILLSRTGSMRLTGLPADTLDYFKKLSGYDTLRVVLAKRIILVEGPSDELIVQRAYRDKHGGALPLEDNVDVINARGLSFKRFLDIASPLGIPVAVVTDNDERPLADIEADYASYTSQATTTLHVGDFATGRTLEPQLLAANGRETLNHLLAKSYATDTDLLSYMRQNKTMCALKLFESAESVTIPPYIANAVL